MSTTRFMIERLRNRLGASAPMAPRSAAPPKIESVKYKRTAYAAEVAESTTALVGIGQAGTRYPTDVLLQFQAELAVAHSAVYEELPPAWAEEKGFLSLHSKVSDHREFLLRPDLGRRLNEESVKTLQAEAKHGIDVQPILADGLSAVACMGSGIELYRAFENECRALGLSVGTPMVARFARVWLEDEIGAIVKARVSAILLGERPGLGTGDGLSAYLVYDPEIGNTDADRNMMSNIHNRGTPPALAAKRLASLTKLMLEQKTSGVNLDLSNQPDLSELAGQGYRAPQVRQWLVEVENDS